MNNLISFQIIKLKININQVLKSPFKILLEFYSQISNLLQNACIYKTKITHHSFSLKILTYWQSLKDHTTFPCQNYSYSNS